MAIFTQENAHVWQGLFDEASKAKPAVGRVVRAMRGKHVGKIGVVDRHMESRYGNAFRYGNEASHAMTQARGRYGFCVLVRTEQGEKFWINADLVMVCAE